MLRNVLRKTIKWYNLNDYGIPYVFSSNIGKYLSTNKNEYTIYLRDKFINYFRSNERYRLYTFHCLENDNYFKFRPKYTNMQGKDAIEKMTVTELMYALYTFKDITNIENNDLQEFLKYADEKCSNELSNMSKQNIYKCIDVWYSVCQGNITARDVYLQFVKMTPSILHSESKEMEELVYIMFYIGMLKNTPKSRKIIQTCLAQLEKNVDHLTLVEICIVINSSFKASVKIKSKKFLDHIRHSSLENLKPLVNNPGYFVTIVKGLRLANVHDYKLMNEIASEHSASIFNMNFIAKVHILALYADSRYNKKNFIKVLIESCVKDLLSVSNNIPESSVFRLKDLSRFLWAVSYLSYNISPQNLSFIIEKLQALVHEKGRKNAEDAVSCLLSLWIMGNKTPLLFNSNVIGDLIHRLKERNLFRSVSRLSLLLTSIQIEMPKILSNDQLDWKINNIIPPGAVDNQLKKRELLQYVHEAIQNLSKNMNVHVICGCFLPNLNIVGITIQSSTGQIMHVEVLDETVCLHNTSLPDGIMGLKLRLLKCLGHKVLTILEDKFEVTGDPSDIYVFLEEELKKLEQFSFGVKPSHYQK